MLCIATQAVGLREAVGLAHMSNYHTKYSSTGEAPGAAGGSHHSNASSSYHSFVAGPTSGGHPAAGPGCLASAQLVADYQGEHYQDHGAAAGSPAGAWRPMSPFPAADAGGFPRVPNLGAEEGPQGGHGDGAVTYLGSQPLHR